MRPGRWRRPWRLALLGAGLVAGIAAWRYFFPPAPRLGPLPTAPVPPTPVVLVVAPHSDDETLAAGGLIQQVEAQAGQAWVLLLTAGDGFRLAAEAALRQVGIPPDQMLAFGRQRLAESRAALAVLGLPPDRLIFLGYPDRGLHRLWLECWTAADPCRSPYTGASHVPYAEALRPGAPYAGREALADLETVLRRLRPAVVVYPHPNDAHVDHWAAHNLVAATLEALRREDPDWKPPAEWLYLVHRGDWPAPKGLLPAAPLLPPAPLASGITAWHQRPLTAQEVQRKEQAVLAYRSQVAVLRRYLLSFVRSTELFGELPRVHLAPAAATGDGEGHAGGSAGEGAGRAGRATGEDSVKPPWPGPWALAITDPERDTVARAVQAPADLVAVWAARDGDRLRLAARARGEPGNQVRYRFLLRGFRAGTGWSALAAVEVDRAGPAQVTAWPGAAPPVAARRQGPWLAVELPLLDLGFPQAVMVGVESRLDGVLIDRTAWRLLALDAPPVRGEAGADVAAHTAAGEGATRVVGPVLAAAGARATGVGAAGGSAPGSSQAGARGGW